MKSWLLMTLFAFTITHVLTDNVCSQVTTGSLSLSIERAALSRDMNDLSRAINALENMWAQTPDEYLRTALQAVQTLLGDPDNDVSQKALAVLFANVFKKTCPINNKRMSISYFDLKREISLSYFGMEATRNDKSRLLAIASFIGEVRSLIILDYTNKGTSRPGLDILDEAGVSDAGLLSDPGHIQAYTEAIKENEDHLLMNEVQSSLLRTDRILTFHLIHSASRFTSGDFKDIEFRNGVVKNARLSDAEARSLHKASVP